MASYGLVVAALGATRLTQRGVPWIITAHLGLPLLTWLITRASHSVVGRVLRASYPVVLLAGLYSAIDVMNGFGAATTWDAPLQAADAWLFHSQPSRDWWRAAPSVFWSTLLHGVYFSYYILVPLPVIVFLAQRRPAALERYLDGLIATFLLCYVTYLLLPVAGPYYEFARPTGAFVDNEAARLVYATLARGSAFGAAFPSSHVAATVAATVGAWLGSRRLGMAMAVPTALLAVGVVYCQMHYVVDSAAGVLLGVSVPLVMAWGQRNAGASDGRPREDGATNVQLTGR
ncbi:MAG: phosphatase PAP2 family protein [Gemmatimonadetes bacterium]|nr:phosphatase PAP2 family protein [Gemmatimonadota bacterium]MBP6443226.1 phosphatase PAP2 family protein [Gemmatimonadales bacterium]